MLCWNHPPHPMKPDCQLCFHFFEITKEIDSLSLAVLTYIEWIPYFPLKESFLPSFLRQDRCCCWSNLVLPFWNPSNWRRFHERFGPGVSCRKHSSVDCSLMVLCCLWKIFDRCMLSLFVCGGHTADIISRGRLATATIAWHLLFSAWIC